MFLFYFVTTLYFEAGLPALVVLIIQANRILSSMYLINHNFSK